jgi:hypothetical protein
MATTITRNEQPLLTNVESLQRKRLVTFERAVGIALAFTATVVLAVTVVTKTPSNATHAVIPPATAAAAVSIMEDIHAPDMPVSPVESSYLPNRYLLQADKVEDLPPTF